MERFELNGMWWLPDNPDHRVAGKLTFDPDPRMGITLKTIGASFDAVPKYVKTINLTSEPIKQTIHRFEIILGNTETGKQVTLVDCQISSLSFIVDYDTQTYNIKKIIEGMHVNQKEELLFEQITIHYTNLANWFKSNIMEEVRTIYDKTTIKNEQTPNSVKAEIANWKVTLGVLPGSIHKPFKEITFLYTGSITLRSEINAELSNYEKIENKILVFLMLATNNLLKEDSIEFINISEHSFGKVIRAYSNSRYISNDYYNYGYLFDYSDIEENFDLYLNKWFFLYEKIDITIQLYTTLLYTPEMYIHSKILTLAQALESYHRVLYGGYYLDNDAYKPYKDKLTGQIDQNLEKSHRDSLKSRIKYGNEYSLRKRITLIVESLEETYGDVVLAIIKNKK